MNEYERLEKIVETCKLTDNQAKKLDRLMIRRFPHEHQWFIQTGELPSYSKEWGERIAQRRDYGAADNETIKCLFKIDTEIWGREEAVKILKSQFKAYDCPQNEINEKLKIALGD